MTCDRLTRTLADLNADWEARCDGASPIPTPWLLACRHFTRDHALADLTEVVRDHPDDTLLALLSLHRTGDELAGRAVVQAMLPKMVLMARSDAAATLEDYLAHLWVRIATYPVARRPHRVAANLALDTLKAVRAAGRAQRSSSVLPGPWVPDPVADATAVLDAGVRLGVIDELTRRTLVTVYVEGRTSAAAGEVLGVSADAVRWRCSKGVRALRKVAPELVDQLAG